MKHKKESNILTPTFIYEEARSRYQEIKEYADQGKMMFLFCLNDVRIIR